jgi:putative ABC transport system permease protein
VVVGGIAADEDYLKTLDIELLRGWNFDPAKIKDTVNEFIVNEAFLRDFALTVEEAVGRQVSLGLVMQHGPGTIVGVVKDFHFASLHEEIRPIVLFNNPDFLSGALVRLSKGDARPTLESIEREWKALVPVTKCQPFRHRKRKRPLAGFL